MPTAAYNGNPSQLVFWKKSLLINLGYIALSVLLFSGSFPNLLFKEGFPFFAWVAYIPIFILLYRVSLAASVFWGAIYGYAAYALFNYWLGAFHPLAGIIVNSIYMVYTAFLFFLLRLAIEFFPRKAYLVQWAIWVAFEYLCTLGYLGYPYGITGYTQWRIIPLIQIASITGVWGVSALVVFPSVWLGAKLGMRNEKLEIKSVVREQSRSSKQKDNKQRPLFSFPFPHFSFSIILWAAALAATLVYGFAVQKDYSPVPHKTIALIQHNTDPWKGGIVQYRNNFNTLRKLSDDALASEPKPDLVVWSETAFVPRIYWHETYRDDRASWLLVKDLLDYLATSPVPFVIGNDDARKDPSKNPKAHEDYRIDYNAAMLFEGGVNTGIYRKTHLVPFTEHFPYERQFPAIHRALVNADTHFWEKGTEATVFSLPGFAFSTPICFEDSFGYLSRKFVQNGAELIVNLSNDAWSQSLPAQNQHLAMAVFRAVENRRSMARATASGQTCGIDPNGRIIAMAQPFTEASLSLAIPIVKSNTVYTRWGDFLAIGFTVTVVFLLLIGGVLYIITKKRRKQ